MQEQILLIEDDPAICDVVKIVLEHAGYDVSVSNTGAIVDELLQEKDGCPSVILMDIYLSGNDGRELTKQLKKTAPTQHIPIVMMSANPHADIDARNVGADDFIAKPFTLETLLGKVKRYIN